MNELAQLAADTFDPVPVTAWLYFVLAIFGVVGGVTAAIAVLWKTVALPQIRDLASAPAREVETKHRAEHEDVEERLNAEALARSTAIARVHDRIDRVHLRIDGLPRT